ncbi:TetR/AcrR family transcriptional regulator [Aeromicrobium sp. UC242_57]|uniref:TetR/AcrR family transcriptional regulator n=1 Tax=Aeromicrobium sp. UC242_57 TaxID=3374624 RepID=UPI0037B521BD
MPDKPTRRSGAVLERAILDAGWREIGERGWSGFTMEGVAARSGVAKTVIYRRWKNRAELAQEMLRRAAAEHQRPVDSTGDLRTDLLTFVTNMSEFLRGAFGDAARGVVSEGDPATRTSMFAETPVVHGVHEIIEHARARGELVTAPSVAAVNLGHAIVMWEFLQVHEPPSHEDLVTLVDSLWLPALRQSA